LEIKEIEEAGFLREFRKRGMAEVGDGETKVRRAFTTNDTIYYRSCQ
jgi:hypothetical protein